MFRDSYSPIDVSVSDLPYQVIDEEIYITISDGTRLAARIWKPVASRTETFPSLQNTFRTESAMTLVSGMKSDTLISQDTAMSAFALTCGDRAIPKAFS